MLLRYFFATSNVNERAAPRIRRRWGQEPELFLLAKKADAGKMARLKRR
jgi:hypothetical protein